MRKRLSLKGYPDIYLLTYTPRRRKIIKGLEVAKVKMQPAIQQRIRQDIGGDEQRVHSVQTSYSNITFKHILLPIWISSYRYQGKAFRFVINGQTGEVQGSVPTVSAKSFCSSPASSPRLSSWWPCSINKIFLSVLTKESIND